MSQLLGHPPVYFAPDNLIVELKMIIVMEGAFIMFVIVFAVGSMVSELIKNVDTDSTVTE